MATGNEIYICNTVLGVNERRERRGRNIHIAKKALGQSTLDRRSPRSLPIARRLKIDRPNDSSEDRYIMLQGT